jgi:hypothetical protein
MTTKAQHVIQLTEALAPWVRVTGAVGRQLGGQLDPGADVRLRDFWTVRDYLDRQASKGIKFKKERIRLQLKDLERQLRNEKASFKGKRKTALNLLRMRYQQARDARTVGLEPKGKYYKADLDRAVKKSQYRLHGIPGKSGLAKGRAVATLPPGSHSDVGYTDTIDVDWQDLEPGIGSSLPLLPPGKRGRGRPRIHPIKTPSGRSRGRPPKNVTPDRPASPSDYDKTSFRAGGRVINLPQRMPIALLPAGR